MSLKGAQEAFRGLRAPQIASEAPQISFLPKTARQLLNKLLLPLLEPFCSHYLKPFLAIMSRFDLVLAVFAHLVLVLNPFISFPPKPLVVAEAEAVIDR